VLTPGLRLVAGWWQDDVIKGAVLAGWCCRG